MQLAKVLYPVCQKALESATQQGIKFNLDFPEIDQTYHSADLEQNLRQLLEFLVTKKPKQISVLVGAKVIIVKTSLVLSSSELPSFLNSINTKSRIGFGTTFQFPL